VSAFTPREIAAALGRLRPSIAKVAVAYLLGAVAGLELAHAGVPLALAHRDSIVRRARTSPILIEDRAGHQLRAAALDFAANLLAGAVPSTIVGVVTPAAYALFAYRGWIGGIVSVDDRHVTRLAPAQRGFYYISALVLQLIPYTLAGAVGVAMRRARKEALRAGGRVGPMGIPGSAWLDAGRVYLVIVPLFVAASLWEFLSRWR
jgi:hypothetical protein